MWRFAWEMHTAGFGFDSVFTRFTTAVGFPLASGFVTPGQASFGGAYVATPAGAPPRLGNVVAAVEIGGEGAMGDGEAGVLGGRRTGPQQFANSVHRLMVDSRRPPYNGEAVAAGRPPSFRLKRRD